VRRAIAAHRGDFAAIAVLIVLAGAVAAYILAHQPAFSFGQNYYQVRAEFSTAAAVAPGQGQSVNIAGVRVGQVGAVSLEDGRAVVRMDIQKRYAPVYRDATVLLRPRTPLKDMYLALDPGTRAAGAIPAGGRLPVASTSPDVNLDEILASLDTDARNYLLLLLTGGAQAFRDGRSAVVPSTAAVRDLRGTLKRFEPLARDTRAFATLLAARGQNIRRAIHNLNLVAGALGGVEGDLAALVSSANTNFSAIASQDARLQEALTLFPGTLAQTTQTLGKVQAFAGALGPALQSLRPFARSLAPALRASRPFLRDTTPVIRDQLRPFAVAVQPLANTLAPAAAKLARATPALARSFGVLGSLFKTLSYQPSGGGQGYLFWGAWLSHIAATLTDLQDAHGPIARGVFVATCPQLDALAQVQAGNASIGALLQLLNPPDRTKICPGDQVK
jgi:phospholipid/cholesterol/gamma-HCH transport system substrate-binding protein